VEKLAESNPSVVDQVYQQLKSMAMSYAFKPGQHLNEIELSKQLGVSRTPLREALGRLQIEGFVRFVPKQGFYSRELNQKEVLDLYELRKAVEIHGIRLAINNAQNVDIEALLMFLQETGPEYGNRTTEELVRLDEIFHERLILMSGNSELARVFRNVNERIHFIRWIAMDPTTRQKTQEEHREVLLALLMRDREHSVALLDRHISQRLETIVSAIKDAILYIYMQAPGQEPLRQEAR